MKIYHSIGQLQQVVESEKQLGNRVGFVPTMGALHDGHLQLVKRSVEENEFTVVSVFVNPTQFNDKKDLVNYPRTLDADCALLESVGCDIVFAPDEAEMYPQPDTRQFAFGELEQVMEGAFRPGHFNGVALIVSKLFDAALPDRAYFGEKDFQQLAIIREMTRQLHYDIEIVPCPIVRELDGLAMSSRNTRLTPSQRKNAAQISQALFKSRTFTAVKSVAEIKEFLIQTVNSVADLRVEYFEIVDARTLQSIQDWSQTNEPIGCIAVFCGAVRLIDNISYAN